MLTKPIKEDFATYALYRQAVNQYHNDLLDIKMANDRELQKPLVEAFKQELEMLCNKYGVYIDYTSDASSDWHGITGFKQIIRFTGSEVEYPLYGE